MLFADFRPQGRKQAQELWNNLIPISLTAQILFFTAFCIQFLRNADHRASQRVDPVRLRQIVICTAPDSLLCFRKARGIRHENHADAWTLTANALCKLEAGGVRQFRVRDEHRCRFALLHPLRDPLSHALAAHHAESQPVKINPVNYLYAVSQA